MANLSSTAFDISNALTRELKIECLSVSELEDLIPSISDLEQYVAKLQILKITNNLPVRYSEEIIEEVLLNSSESKHKHLYVLARLAQLTLPNLQRDEKTSFQNLNELLAISSKKNELKLWLSINAHIITHYLKFNKLTEAKRLIDEVLPLCNNESYLDEKIHCLVSQADINAREINYSSAIEKLYKTIELANRHSYRYFLPRIYCLLTTCYTDHNKKIELLKTSIEISKESGTTYFSTVSHVYISQSYGYLGKVDQAVEHANKALQICEKLGSEGINTNAYMALIRAYIIKLEVNPELDLGNEYKKINAYSLKLIEFGKKSKQFYHLFIVSLIRAQLLYHLKDYEKAIEVLENLEISKRKDQLNKSYISEYTELLFQNYLALKNYKKALHYHIEFSKLNDEINEASFNEHTQELQTKYESKEKEAELSRLHELEKVKARFFSQITHELRTPLTLIKGPTENILNSNDIAKSKKSAEIINRNADRLLLLVNQLLDVNKLEAGKMKLKTKVGYIDEFFNELANSFNALAKKKKISFDYKVNIAKLALNFDADKIEKIIYNLLSNAFKFTPEGGSVSFEVRASKGSAAETVKLQIIIKDSGIGMNEEHLENIFDRFYQIDNSDTRVAEGTGIGLALVNELTELMDGEIRVESKLNNGTSFYVSLNLEIAESEAENLVQTTISPIIQPDFDKKVLVKNNAKQISETPILLIIEDNADMRLYIEDMFSDEYKILFAHNGKEGIDLALEHIPDIIISDVMMPIKDGYEVCNEIKTNSASSHIPLILLTAKAALKSRIEGFEQGADAYISKPFSSEELRLQCKNLLTTVHQARDRNIRSIKEYDLSSISKDKESEFLKNIVDIIHENMDDPKLNSEKLARLSYVSGSQLYRKIKALTGCSTSEMIRTTRLAKAKYLLENKKGNVSEISVEVGLRPSYFSKIFKNQYGISPREILENQG